MTATSNIDLWSKDKFNAVGDKCKGREAELREMVTIGNGDSFIIRVDGRAFHTFTRSLKKPFDQVFINAMKAAATATMANLKCQFAYVQSDEISYVFKGGEYRSTPGFQHPFGGRVDKLLSITASLTSVAFFAAMTERMPELLSSSKMLPHFDARLAEVGQFEDVLECVQWRENDAMRNSVAMASQSMYSQSQLHGKGIAQQLDMIKQAIGNIGFTSYYSAEQRRGTYIRMVKERRVLSEDERMQIPEHFRPDAGVEFMRTASSTLHFDDWDIDTRMQALWAD